MQDARKRMISLKLRTPEDDSDRKLLSDIEAYGWHMVVIEQDDSGPEYIFTVGLYYTFGHPEIAIMGLPREVMSQLLQNMFEQIQMGEKYSEAEQDNKLASFPIAFRHIDISRYHDYLGYGVWFYKNLQTPFPALQAVWPDKEGMFPWNDNYDKRFLARQDSLCTGPDES